MARLLVYTLWRLRVDPDNAAIPFLTGAGDFLGTGLLTLSYVFLEAIGDESAHSPSYENFPHLVAVRWTAVVRRAARIARVGPPKNGTLWVPQQATWP